MNRRLHTVDYSGKGKRYADEAERTSRTAHKTRKIWEEIGPFPGGGPAGSAALRQTGAPGTAQSKAEDTFCFPLETTQWRVSDGYGWREDPFTGKQAFHKGIDLALRRGHRHPCGAGRHRALHKTKCQLWQLHGASACGWNSGGVCPSAVYLCPSGRSRRGRAASRHGRAERPGHRGTSAF